MAFDSTATIGPKDIVLWILGALLSILLWFGNQTLTSINDKLTLFQAALVNIEGRLSKVEEAKDINSASIHQLQDELRQDEQAGFGRPAYMRRASAPRPAADPPALLLAHPAPNPITNQ